VPTLTFSRIEIFRVLWRVVHVLLIASLLFLGYCAGWEYSVRHYLKGFSDAVIPTASTPEAKIEGILLWIRTGPPRAVAANPDDLALRDPEITLNYRQLLAVCGTATNAFLNLSRSAGLQARRLLLLTPEGNTKHVVAEVLVNGRWIIVDPAFRAILRDSQGHMLTRQQLRDPAMFAEATGKLTNYSPIYDYQRYAHVRWVRLPWNGFGLPSLLAKMDPAWDEDVDWSLLLERESFFFLFISLCTFALFLSLRLAMSWYGAHGLHFSRYYLRRPLLSAGVQFFSTPEMKE
jgi:hypothetical protein